MKTTNFLPVHKPTKHCEKAVRAHLFWFKIFNKKLSIDYRIIIHLVCLEGECIQVDLYLIYF